MGGASYVNVLYIIRTSDKLPAKYKEMGIMTCTMFNDLGVLSASFFSLLMTSVVYSRYIS